MVHQKNPRSLPNGSPQLGHTSPWVLNQHNRPRIPGLQVLRWGGGRGGRRHAPALVEGDTTTSSAIFCVRVGHGCSQTHPGERELGWAKGRVGAAPGGQQGWGVSVRRSRGCLGWDTAGSSSPSEPPSAPQVAPRGDRGERWEKAAQPPRAGRGRGGGAKEGGWGGEKG